MSQRDITEAIAWLFFSSIIMWPLPWIPTSASLIQVGRTPACPRGHLRSVELIEDRIAGLAFAGPLSVETGLRPQIVAFGRDEALQCALEIHRTQRSVPLRLIGGAAAARLIDHIDRVALAEEELGPTLTAVRSSGEIGPALIAAVNHDYRPGVSAAGGNLEFGIKLAAHNPAVFAFRVSSAGEHVALAGDYEIATRLHPLSVTGRATLRSRLRINASEPLGLASGMRDSTLELRG
jgi:hypothetical protein